MLDLKDRGVHLKTDTAVSVDSGAEIEGEFVAEDPLQIDQGLILDAVTSR